ncbi:MAG: hypothetical protein ACYTFV_06265, partial [Planctomycetota bacterium]
MTLSTPPHATARARRRATTKGATARISIALLALLPMSAGCRTTGCVAAKPVDPTLIGTIDELYAAFNFDAGEHPDWDVQRRIALPGATFVPSIRADRAPEGTDLDRFLADFEQFVETSPYRETGFHERIVGLHTEQFGGIAQVWVAFEGFVPGGEVETDWRRSRRSTPTTRSRCPGASGRPRQNEHRRNGRGLIHSPRSSRSSGKGSLGVRMPRARSSISSRISGRCSDRSVVSEGSERRSNSSTLGSS